MSVEAITWALRQDVKHSSAKFVLVAIANCADGSEFLAWPSVQYLVDATSQDRKTVMSNLARLRDAGLIEDSGERRGSTKQVVVYRLKNPENGTVKQSQKRNSTENGTVPKTDDNSTVFPAEESQNSLERVPKTVHGTVRNHKGTVKEPSVSPAQAPGATSAGQKAKPKTKPKAMSADLQARFDRFYAAYPRKTDRSDAEKAFAKLAPSEEMLAQMLDAIERGKAAGAFADIRFTKHPATWLNAGSWMDEYATAYTPQQLAVIEVYNQALGAECGRIDPDIYTTARAGQIDDFLTLSAKPDFWRVFFPWVRDNCTLPNHVGFDYLISRDGFSKVKGGQFQVTG